MRKSPKLFVADAALAAYLLGLHSRDAILQGSQAGALLETAVAAEWTKAFRNAGLRPPLYHGRSAAGHEVGLVIEHDGRVYGVEA